MIPCCPWDLVNFFQKWDKVALESYRYKSVSPKIFPYVLLCTSTRGEMGTSFRLQVLLHNSETLGAWKILGHIEIVLFSLNPRNCIIAFRIITIQYLLKLLTIYGSWLYESLVQNEKASFPLVFGTNWERYRIKQIEIDYDYKVHSILDHFGSVALHLRPG